MPLRNASEGLELEDVFSTLDDETRDNSRAALEGFGDAFAGRGRVAERGDPGAEPLLHEPARR